MDWSAPIDAYCERLGPQFWAEPVNAVTNGAFLLAAFAAWMLWRRQARGDAGALFLIVVVACVGIGSFLFHTFATRWSALADVVPIAVFIYSYFLLAMRRILQLGWGWSIGATLAFLAASYGVAPMLSGILGSSAGYVPAALAIFGVAAVAARRCPPASAPLALTGAVFVISLAFRTSDIPFCPSFPLGTHFVWHCLNALVLYLLIRVLVLVSPVARSGNLTGATGT
ncbi:ceramidase domain-containing protein [Stappia sp. WLB 29]|uniref:ceramidase domain-containing protein n=1 Tax=Stappia sp. WLB 29 TaxID=2925220 RepID=UPI0020C0C459|nr:ceramidase domain-containing protein [Stappia sp. WLB 29]